MVEALDARLALIAQQIRANIHADIGSDHAYLLKALLQAKRIGRGIAVENKRGPFLNSQRTLRGFTADVRCGDGLEPLAPGEVDSLSMCGMGARLMVRLLERFPNRVPDRVILQPNTEPHLLRQWGRARRFHLQDEGIVGSRRHERVLTFIRADAASENDDPAYNGLDRDLAIAFGPWQVRCPDEVFLQELHAERRRLEALPRLERASQQRLLAVRRLLA